MELRRTCLSKHTGTWEMLRAELWPGMLSSRLRHFWSTVFWVAYSETGLGWLGRRRQGYSFLGDLKEVRHNSKSVIILNLYSFWINNPFPFSPNSCLESQASWWWAIKPHSCSRTLLAGLCNNMRVREKPQNLQRNSWLCLPILQQGNDNEKYWILGSSL